MNRPNRYFNPRRLVQFAAVVVIFSFLYRPAFSEEPSESVGTPEVSEKAALIYVIPIRDEIQKAMTYVVKRAVKEALAAEADALILHMETPGGEGQAMKEIMESIEKFDPDSQTYTLVDKEAFSAGAFISASTRHIYMTPGSIIGAAAPVIMGQEGPQELPSKFVSAFAAQVRVAAEKNGHRVEVFDAMVNKEKELVINGEELVSKGDILTLTTKEASKLYDGKPLIATEIDSLDALIEKIGIPEATVVTIEPTRFEQVARFIVMIAPFLMTAAFILGYIEFKSPGFGIFGISAILCALVFFFGHYIAGVTIEADFSLGIVLFALGLALIAVEIFVFPGSLVFGLAGVGLIIISLLRAMIDSYPGDPVIPTMPQLEMPITNLSISMVLSLIAMWLFARILPKTPMYNALVLSGSTEMPITKSVNMLEIGNKGTANSYLRPSGTVDFGDGPVDVITEGDFIPSGTKVKITSIKGNKVVVEMA
ncbi:MAG: NfeD family protein [Verrucomicrobiota bacterium]